MVAALIMSFYSVIQSIKRRFSVYALPIGIFCNFILLFLILTNCTAAMRSFKKVMILICVTDILFCISTMLFSQAIIVQNGFYYIIMEGIFGPMPRFLTFIGFNCFIFSIYASVTNATVVFFYRFLSVCLDRILSGRQFMLFVGIGWSIIGVYCGTCTYEFTLPVTNATYAGLAGTDYPSDGSFTYFISSDPDKLTPLVFYIAVPMVTVSYICVILMSFAVWWNLRRLRSLMSHEQQQFHHEVNIVLWIEALTPFVTVVVPIYLGLAKVAIPTLPVDWFAELNFILTLSGPTFTAVLKLFSIQAFRQAFKRAKYKFMKSNKVAVVTLSRSRGSLPASLNLHTLSTTTKHY